MALGPSLQLRQSQGLAMTPQLQQAIKLLALSNLELETYISEALEANPLLDLGENTPLIDAEQQGIELPESRRTTLESSPVDQLMGEGRAAEDRPLDIDDGALDADRDVEDYSRLQSIDSGWTGSSRSSENEGPDIEERGDSGPSLAQHLYAQLSTTTCDAQIATIAATLIDQIDEAGYLSVDLADLSQEFAFPIEQAETALALIQSFDPTGVGARNLAECIALQAIEANRYDPAMAQLIDNFDLLGRGELSKLKRLCGVDDEDFADMLVELRSYDPKPGLRFGTSTTAIIIPDIILSSADNNSWHVSLNPASLPRLIVNRSYYLELRQGCTDKSAKRWLSEKLTDANWLIKALDQRQKTILKVTAELVKQQAGFFQYGVSRLRPLTLRAVAEAIEMHESTISRVTTQKYLSCDQGTFELKYFFSSGVASSDSEHGASAATVKAAIRQLIDKEDAKAILSDDTLVELLRGQGFDLARRTVAKYREAIGLGSSVQRRRQKALSAAL